MTTTAIENEAPAPTPAENGGKHSQYAYSTGPEDAQGKVPVSGKIIVASNLLPWELSFGKGGEWNIEPRKGNTALHSSFQHLSSKYSHWDTTLVGWTGNINPISKNKVIPAATTPTVEKKAQLSRTPLMGPQSPRTPMTPAPALRSPTTPVPPLRTPTTPAPGALRRTITMSSLTSIRPIEEILKITKQDREALEKMLLDKSREKEGYGKSVPVWLGDEENGELAGLVVGDDGERWGMLSQKVLWPLLHYILPTPTDGESERQWWRDYQRFNLAFADKIMELYQPGDLVWVHDYQLLLVPEILRQRAGANIYIGLFLHTPFPSSEIIRCLSRRKEILEGMLGANLIGFQSQSYLQHFLSSCTRILGYDTTPKGVKTYGSHCAVGVFSIGIDVAKVKANASQPGIDEKMKVIREMYAGKKIIVGRDRLDSVRGVVQKLRAFEAFLEMYEEWREKVVLIQVTSPAISESKGIEHKVSELAGHINGTYGSLDFTPVQHYPQYLGPDEYLALLRVADLGLITSVRDGMNTTSLEYVVCQKDTHGPVIVSEFTGTASSLTDAIRVNPWDTKGVARTIDYCLRLPKEKKKAIHERLYKHVTTNTVQAWNCNFLNMLLKTLSSEQQRDFTPVLDRRLLLDAYKAVKGGKRLLMFDYDGTLTPIVRDPDAAIPTDKVIRTIKKLAADPQNEVWIISGRDQEFLAKWMGHIAELGLSAEHGCFMKHPHATEWENLIDTADMSWQQKIMDIFGAYTEKTPGSFIERKKCAITWHYRKADPDFAAIQVTECQELLENTVAKEYDLEVMPGKCNLEIRPKFVNKGEIAKRLLGHYRKEAAAAAGEPAGPGFVLCAGDDTTDEDMFKSLRDSTLPSSEFFTVHIGPSSKNTMADYHLLEPSDMIESIGLLVGIISLADLGIVPAVVEVPPKKEELAVAA
ncbi:glycosyltransferase family 20-domain-containing protein [Kalaharituber pfeilii]|nr:glycosyltransferase family 20-domain-containing protein [Kalaharituber pfeilii]